MTEIWKKIFENYEVSSCGRIRNSLTLKILKTHKEDDGYIRIRIHGHGSHYVHRLVAIGFIENINNYPTVDHIDRQRDNNNVENLRWASSKIQSTNISNFGRLKRKVAKIDSKTKNIIAQYDSIKEASNSVPNSDGRLISAVCRGKRNNHAGFEWKYMDIDDELEDEIWILMEEYDGHVSISNHGRIKFKDGRVSTGSLSTYKRIHLKKNGKDVHMLIHKLVAKYFIENPNSHPIINHKDGDKTNNHVDNLEWCTHSQNVTHAHENGLISKEKTKEPENIEEIIGKIYEIIKK